MCVFVSRISNFSWYVNSSYILAVKKANNTNTFGVPFNFWCKNVQKSPKINKQKYLHCVFVYLVQIYLKQKVFFGHEMEQETSDIPEVKAIPNVKLEQINTNGEVNK